MNTFPKFTPLGGCYNYNRLKNEGLIGKEDITCTIDDVEVDCKTWGDPEEAKKEAQEIESMMDFMWNYDS